MHDDSKGAVQSSERHPVSRGGGKAEILITDYRGKLLNGPNDVWKAKDGGYYLTDPYFKRDYWTRDPERQQPVEGLYYLAPEGKQLVMLDSTLNQPNGLVGTPDGRYLYVAEAKANRILRYDIQTDGSLSNRQVFADMGSDGMTIDKEPLWILIIFAPDLSLNGISRSFSPARVDSGAIVKASVRTS